MSEGVKNVDYHCCKRLVFIKLVCVSERILGDLSYVGGILHFMFYLDYNLNFSINILDEMHFR